MSEATEQLGEILKSSSLGDLLDEIMAVGEQTYGDARTIILERDVRRKLDATKPLIRKFDVELKEWIDLVEAMRDEAKRLIQQSRKIRV